MSHRNPITSENIKSTIPAVSSAISKRYKDSTKKAYADKAHYYANEFLFNRPIGMASDYKIGDLQREMVDYVERKFKENELSEDAKGFFGLETIALFLLSAIISYVVRIILNKLFDMD